MKKKQNKHSETFFSSFIEDFNTSPEWVAETLNEHNIDQDAVAARSKALAGKLISQMKLKTAKAAKQGLLQKAGQLLQLAGNTLSDLQPKEKLIQLLSVHQQATFTFSSLKDFSTEDVLQMLSEIELMELIEKLEKEK